MLQAVLPAAAQPHGSPGWERDASAAFKPAHPGAPAQLLADPAKSPHPLAQGRGHLAARLQAPLSSSRSLLQAPAS